MYAGSIVLHTLFLMLILDGPCTYGSKPGNCTIAVKRGMQYTARSGNTATINCTVTYCQEKPILSWYKGHFKVQDGERHNTSWTSNQLFVLTISPVHKNDSGHYRCAGKAGNHSLNGHSTEVIIQDEPFENATNTTEDGGATEKSKQWIISSLSVLGVLCLLTLSFIGLLCFARKHSARNKKTDDILQSEMKMFSIYTDVQHCSDSTIHDSDEGSMCRQGAKSCLPQFRDGSADYDNDNSCWKATGTISNPGCDYSVLTIHQPLPVTQETLLYATLNYDEPFQRSIPSVATECIEYAAIGMKNKCGQHLSSH
ncbi:B- and T-lymphocyte attenuator-like [Tiliqua scincoides]|uniref:B- and T-lymphocyte attenuator-like n=1 Tax=Tiliqua scincoides TaxID=71010 RepID=UPI0034620AA2